MKNTAFYEIPVDNTHHYKRVDIQFEYAANDLIPFV